MLIKNGELLKTKEQLREFNDFVKNELPHLSNPVTFRHPRPVQINETGLKEEQPMFNVLMTASVESPEGLDVWAYTENLKRSKDGDYIPDFRSFLWIQGSLA